MEGIVTVINDINQSFDERELKFEIKSVVDDYSNTRLFILVSKHMKILFFIEPIISKVNCQADNLSELATSHTSNEIQYFKAIVCTRLLASCNHSNTRT